MPSQNRHYGFITPTSPATNSIKSQWPVKVQKYWCSIKRKRYEDQRCVTIFMSAIIQKKTIEIDFLLAWTTK